MDALPSTVHQAGVENTALAAAIAQAESERSEREAAIRELTDRIARHKAALNPTRRGAATVSHFPTLLALLLLLLLFMYVSAYGVTMTADVAEVVAEVMAVLSQPLNFSIYQLKKMDCFFFLVGPIESSCDND